MDHVDGQDRALSESVPENKVESFTLRGAERYTMAEAARIKGVSYHTVSRAVRNGRLPVFRLGRMGLISGEDLETWQPMRERAPRKYRHAAGPVDIAGPVALDEALGERLEIARQLATLFEVIHAASSELTLVEFGELLANRFSTMFGLSRVSLWVWNSRDGTGERVAHIGDPLTATAARIDVSSGYQKFMSFIEHGNAHVSLDPRTEFADRMATPVPLPAGPLLIVPLRVRNRSIGAILGDCSGELVPLDQHQLSLAQVLGNQAALAVDNAMLRKDERFRITQLSAILDLMTEQVRACDTDGRINLCNRSDMEFQESGGGPPPEYGANALENPAIAARHELDGTLIGADSLPLARALRGEHVIDREYEITMRNGRVIRALMNARPIVIDNEITGAVYIGRNVTAEREAEQRAQQRVVRIERATAWAEAVANMTIQCVAARTPQEAVQVALGCLTDGLESTGGLAFMVQDDGGLMLSATSKVSDSIRVPVVYDPISISTTILAFSRRAPVAVTREEAGRAEQATMALLDSSGLLVVPLQANDDPFGALYLYHDDTLQLEDDVVTFAATIGRLCAQALERLRLLEELDQARARFSGTGDPPAMEAPPVAPISPAG